MAIGEARWWFWLHSWVGLQLSLLLGFVVLTGTCGVLSHEIDWLLSPEMRALAAVEPDDIAWGAAFDAARKVRPGVSWMSLERPAGPAFALQGTVFTSWREPRRLWFDPVDGAFRGETRWFNAQRALRMLHRHLMLPPKIGVPIVAALSLPLFVSLVSGLVVYKRFWRGFFRRPRFGRGPRLVFGDLHRLLGVWSSWFVALMVVTGIWYLAESLGGRAPELPEARETSPRADALPPDFDGARLDRAIAAARRELPGLEVLYVGFPREPDEPLVVSGDLTASLVRVRANRVSIDPVSGAVLGRYRAEELGLHQRISEAADPLHFGTFGGLATKILWLLFGAGLTALAFSGALVYVERMRREAGWHRGRSDAIAQGECFRQGARGATGRVGLWWRGMTRGGRGPSLTLVLLSLVLAVVWEPVPLDWTDHGERSLGPLKLRLSTRGRVQAGRMVDVRLGVTPVTEAPSGLEIQILGGPRRDVPASERHETSLSVPEQAKRVVIHARLPDRDAVARWDLGPPG